jgi:hypothetical protein
MVSVVEVQALVACTFDGLDLPSWSDPHPDMASPREEEYSRITDPGRYRIVHARARVWAAALENAVGARTEPLTPPPAAGGDRQRGFDRGVRVVPPVVGALPLVLLERDVRSETGDAPLAVLEIGVVRPDIVVEMVPDCGCDACDSGSSDLLEAIDATIGAVVGGPFVVLSGKTWRAQWHPGGGQASSEGHDGADFRELMDLCRRLADGQSLCLPDEAEAFIGQGWLD